MSTIIKTKKMQKNYIIILFLLIFFCFEKSFSQSFYNINWDNDLNSYNDFESNDLFGLFSNHYIEYKKSEFSDEVFIYETHHMKTKINREINESIDEIFISKINVLKILNIRVKVISQDSSLIYNFSEMKKLRTPESNDNYDYYKLPNIKENDIVEVIYTVQKEYNFNGYKFIEESYPILSSKFILIENEFKSNIKIYNNPNLNIKDTIIEGIKAKYIHFKNIIPTKDEQYATPIANKIKVAYQCQITKNDISQNEYWANLVRNVKELFFPASVNSKAVNLLKEIRLNPNVIADNEISIVNAIDEYVKNNFSISEIDDPNLNNIDYIFENSTSNDFSIIQVYTNLLKEAKINYEVAISCNRYYQKFDPDFFDPNQLREFLIYLPDYDKYVSPSRIEYRVSEAPNNLLGNYGIFIENNLEYYFSEITQSNKNFSQIEKNLEVSISRNLKKLKITESRSYSGYWAIINRNYVYLSENEKTDFLIDYFTINGIDDKKVSRYNIKNFNISDNIGNDPLIIDTKLITSELIEKNNESVNLKIGKVIGIQSNLYSENNRLNPIEINFPNEYNYKIVFHIPDGYKIIEFSELIMNENFVSVDGGIKAKFSSNAEIIDNKLIVNIQEYYKDIKYEKSRYEEFRQVINAAANFYESSIKIIKD